MISQKFARLIETHSDELCRRWLKEVQNHPDTLTYHHYPESKLIGHIQHAFAHLSEMIEAGSRERIRERYEQLGAERFQEGFPLNEVLKAFILARRLLWTFVQTRGAFNMMEVQQMIEIRHQTLLFFDRAMFFTARGYEREAAIYKKVASL
ncbi:MAG: hypothetical protein C5B54_09940 [Acidobacteria bacterium]|nr:MAG: hypothetical protein C5B54_09940 [Acidobacteriota bacterium]